MVKNQAKIKREKARIVINYNHLNDNAYED